ncbi:uncharacterized protein DS421_10g300770 [Arachis hypogaea]|nr:uncharacterized protein DS421_10g300770 [Arachis hypogaea]
MNGYSLNIFLFGCRNARFVFVFLSFSKHLVFHKNWGRYNLYAKAILSNFRALKYVSDADDFHKRFLTYHKIPSLENPHFSKPRK